MQMLLGSVRFRTTVAAAAIVGITLTAAAVAFVVLLRDSFTGVNEDAQALAIALLIGVPVFTLLVAAGTWLVVGRALAPVESMRREVDSIGGDELDRRVPVPRSADEITRLATTMNEMLARVEDAYQKQERFVADAAHELRSPLTSLRIQLEVDGGSESAALLREVIRMQRLVDDLLLLARSDAGQLRIGARPVDLDDIVLEEAARLRSMSEVAIDTARVSDAQVRGDSEQLLRVIRNLMENAVRHAESTVTLSLGETDGTAELVVADDGPGVPPEQRDRIFERFARLDASRARGRGGAGLGLAIARTISQAHGGTLTLDDGAEGSGARFVVRLPVAGGTG